MEEQGLLLSDILDLNETYRAISRSKPVQHHALTTVRRSCSAENMPYEKVDDDRLGKTTKHRRKSLESKEEFTRENARKTMSTSIECSVDIDQLINDGSPRVVGRVTGSGLGNELSITNKNNLDSVSWSKMQKGSTMPIYLKFSEIRYKVRGKGKSPSEMENILFGVTGSVDPGEILALMGPSGGGKTTLLNLLSGRTNIKDQGGSVTYNDQPYSKGLKGRIGFVLQDDVTFPHLTVRETLTYTALLRLPNIQTKQQKEERAMSVISELGLERCQDMLIGGALVRGISGGERKRVCIGNEILLDPSLLFLDEPTSGLDSTTALRIAQMLQNIAQAGKTVVTTIHQPSSRMFSKFDKLILLGKGSSLYFGKASEAMLYFSSIGCSPLIAMNPAEFLVDLANGNINDKSIPSELTDKFSHGSSKGKHQDGRLSPTAIHEYLVGAYEINVARAEKMKLLEPVPLDSKWETKGSIPRDIGASWWEQYSILFWRGLKERRHDYLSYVRVTQVLSTAVIIGLLWWHSDSSSPEKLQDQGLGLAIGAALIDIKKATTLASIIIMTFMLAGGFFVERVPFFMSWIRYLSFNYHTYRLLLKVQYDCSNARHNGFTPCLSTFVEGLRLDNGGIEAGALIAMVFGYRLMAYLFLRNMKIRSAN